MRGGSTGSIAATALLTLIVAAIVTTDLAAHRSDEYLQAARLAISPSRVDLQLDLTPGIAVADRILNEIDQNHDSALSPAEQARYVDRVLEALALDIDRHPLDLQLVSSTFPAADALKRGEGTIAIHATAALPPLPNGLRRLSFRNSHHSDIGVYLANVLVPDSDRVFIDEQRRDVDQHNLTVEYTLHPDATPLTRVALIASFTSVAIGAAFLLRRAERGQLSVRRA
jgi:hypothetical protein